MVADETSVHAPDQGEIPSPGPGRSPSPGHGPGRSPGLTPPPGPLLSAARDLLGVDARPLSGGYSGETFLVGAPGEEAVLRLYVRNPDRAVVDAALHSLLRDLIPVPRILEMRTQGPAPAAPAFLLTERLPGERMDLWLAEAPRAKRRAAGESAGRLLARLVGIPFLRSGQFVGADLAVQPWPTSGAGLEDWVEAHRGRGAFAQWSDDDLAGLLEVARYAQDLLDAAPDRACLAHSDVNPKNLLVDPTSGEITGLVDWEYAHSGSPYTDVGNLLRFETDEAFCTAVVATFAAQAPAVSPQFVELGRAVDLLALVDLAARDGGTPVVDQACRLLREMSRYRNLAAGRPTWR
ncbi:phosphotransferase [Actinopolymorpha sp. B9G3]|uniref:phosphotransferase family protein n=1 Tax=Actinopolymorpha sp. B9G3 TaxID=3158970 RepID=UPI0032D9592E